MMQGIDDGISYQGDDNRGSEKEQTIRIPWWIDVGHKTNRGVQLLCLRNFLSVVNIKMKKVIGEAGSGGKIRDVVLNL